MWKWKLLTNVSVCTRQKKLIKKLMKKLFFLKKYSDV